jgi:hypothetical protein
VVLPVERFQGIAGSLAGASRQQDSFLDRGVDRQKEEFLAMLGGN